VDHDEDREEIDHRRENGHDHDVHVGDLGHLGHDEAAGPHDRGHEHAADGGGGLDGAGDMRSEAGFFHQRNGEGAGGDGVGDGRSRNRPEEA
jgi:hypothetical protein